MHTTVYDLSREYDAGIDAAAKAIAGGKLVIFPTETVYGIGADASSASAVTKIFAAKGRPADNPLIVHIAKMTQVYEIAQDISPLAEKLMQAFWPGPFTVVLHSKGNLPHAISAGLTTVAVRMPSAKVAQDLILHSGCMIAAPSANKSGKPSGTGIMHVLQDFENEVPIILDGGDTQVGLESTVCDATGEVPVLLRPGAITAEMIQKVAGSVKISPAVQQALDENTPALSPGMKYMHYAPEAKVVVVKGEKPFLANAIKAMYDSSEKAGFTAEILCLFQSLLCYENRNAQSLGDTVEEEAHALFDALRKADAAKVDVVFFEAVEESGLGLAVMNRILRAAGFLVVDAMKEGDIDAYIAGLHR